MEITWEDPPPSLHSGPAQRSAEWDAFISALKENPGKWARWHRTIKSTAGKTTMKQKIITRHLNPEHYEYTTRTVEKGQNDSWFYMRYIGP